jgi:hypothetical protein
MITCDLRGQLGNQMFIVATVIAHALKMKTSYAFPLRSGKRGQFPFMFDHLPLMQEWNGDIFDSTPYKEKQFGVYSPLPEDPNLHLAGYFQSEKYFKEYRNDIISIFNMPVVDKLDGVVSLHIRRGDSLKFVDKLPQPSDNYILNAINYFGNNYNFLVFSDDIEWCKGNKLFKGSNFNFVDKNSDPKINMSIMSSCEHNIIVNSTYSWWAAWLNNNLNKVVVSPDKISWFGGAYKNRLSAQDIVCDGWIEIKYLNG